MESTHCAESKLKCELRMRRAGLCKKELTLRIIHHVDIQEGKPFEFLVIFLLLQLLICFLNRVFRRQTKSGDVPAKGLEDTTLGTGRGRKINKVGSIPEGAS